MKKYSGVFYIILIAFFAVIPLSYAEAENNVLKLGMSGSDVLELQTKLKACGFYDGKVDGIFGSQTYSAVVKLQSQQGLEVDGMAGSQTLSALDNILSNMYNPSRGEPGNKFLLKTGMSGDDVLQLQTKLKQFGFYQGALDGIFGSMTRAAVFDFQLSCGLDADGVAGDKTLQALRNYNLDATSRGELKARKTRSIVSFALKFLGTPYVWGGSSPYGFDCSGFTSYVYKEFGIYLPHAADEQFASGYRVKQLEPGDLVFFSTYEPGPSHVGIYIGNNQFIHSSSGTGQVSVTQLSESYYSNRYLGAVRILN